MTDEFRPLFIVGTSRSGTTMINRILGNHEAIAALNELHYLGKVWDITRPPETLDQAAAVDAAATLLMHIRRGLWESGISDEEREDAKSLLASRAQWTHAEIYREVLQAESGHAGYVTDQTPKNVYYIDTILDLYPGARIIHMLRDPRAVLYSQRNRWKVLWRSKKKTPVRDALRVLFNYHPVTLTKLWKTSASIARSHREAERYKLVLFEDLVSDPERQVRSICEFLGIGFHDSMLDVPQVGSSNKQHDYSKRGITTDVVDAWKDRLPKGDIYLCEQTAGKLLGDFGYEPVSKTGWALRSLGSLIRFPFHVLGSLVFNPKVILVQLKALANLK